MRKTITRLAKGLVVLLFATAISLGLSRALTASTSLDCDTPTGICTNNDDCVDACWVYNGTMFGGECQSSGCCMCLE